MRFAVLPALGAYLVLASVPVSAQSTKNGPPQSIANAPYPNEVTLIQNQARQWTFLDGKTQHPLYVYDKDGRDESNCYDLCDTKWIPLIARPDSTPMGEWTLARRKDGKRQWAFRHHPVYMLVHDNSDTPLGDGKDGHHVLPTFN